MHIKRNYLISSLMAGAVFALSLTGCSPPRDEPETEAATSAQTQEETETETVEETEEPETETEKILSLKDIQASIERKNRTGNASYEVASSEILSGVFYYKTDGSVFYAASDSGEETYSNQESTVYKNQEGCMTGTWPYVDIWELVYGDCTLGDNVEINGTECYHIQTEYEDDAGTLLGMLGAIGYENLIGGTIRIDFYVSVDSFTIIRADTSMTFLGDKNGDSNTGEFTCCFYTAETPDSLEITPLETEAETEEDAYTAGTINSNMNLYINSFFDLQIAGKELLIFDADKTSELEASYKEAGSSYMEEAYASTEGNILNVSSILVSNVAASTGKDVESITAEDVLSKYYSDSGAEDTKSPDEITVGGNVYSTLKATINNTKTKTYCTVCDGRALIITFYYSENSSVKKFQSQLYNMSENANWEEETWTLQGKYQITTPNGYSIIQSSSSEMYVCMQDSSYQVNIFALTNVSLDSEIESETVSSGSVTREVVDSEDISYNDNGVIKYLVVHNTESVYDYYTYVGLMETDGALIKLYTISTSDSENYKDIYIAFANNISVIEQETENSSELPAETSIE